MKNEIDLFANIVDHYRYAVFSVDGSTTVISITGKQLKERGLKECEKSFARLKSCIDDEKKRKESI